MVACRLAKKEASWPGLISAVGAAIADMRTGGYLCGAPEVGRINVICIEMSRFYGMPVTGGAVTVGLAKIMTECDVVGMIKRFVRDGPVDASTALTGDIATVEVGGHYLGAKSTRQFSCAGEFWQPRVFQREPFETYAGRSLAQDAAERAREILAKHAGPPLAEDVATEIDRVIERYARAVGAPQARLHWRGPA